MAGFHEPVLLREILENIDLNGWVIDATLGDGGHSLEILKRGGRILGLDVDPQSLEIAGKRFEEAGIDSEQYRLVQTNFRDIKIQSTYAKASVDKTELRAEQTGKKYTSVIFDLGVSSRELEDSERGFSFLKNGPLDMRMDPTLGVTAKDLVNGLTKGELYELIFKLGEENHAKRFSEALVRAREVESITTTGQLAKVIERSAGGRQGKIHPATRVFQALRIAVNDELHAVEEALPQVLEVVDAGGRILIISFHSLEDRIVKNTFKEWEAAGLGNILTTKPMAPTEEEVLENPRSRSAKMRIFEKLR